MKQKLDIRTEIPHNSILETIGNTPLIKIGNIYAKLETTNPTGSIKDRLAWYLVKKAEERGELKKGDTILEVTSGNIGISLALISAIRGYRFIAIMPHSIYNEKQKMIESFGAEIVLTPAEKGRKGSLETYEKMVTQFEDVWLPRQFENPETINAHKNGIGREIIDQMKGNIDAFVACAGSGGTLFGVALALKQINPKVRIVAIEPTASDRLSGIPGCHSISGIDEDFIPKHIREYRYLIDEVVTISSQNALQICKELARKHGVLVGISSGANVLAARKIAQKYRNVITVLPDRGERYLSFISKENP
jgi:cysteine synthase A